MTGEEGISPKPSKLVSFLGLLTGLFIGEGLLTGGEGSLTGTQVTQRQLHHWPPPQ